MNHRMRSILLFLAALFTAFTAPSLAQPHQFSANERAIGATTRDWAFMSAWNLANGNLEVSPAWFNGTNTWTFTRPAYQQWIAKFIYRQSAGQTRELQWSFTQKHVQFPIVASSPWISGRITWGSADAGSLDGFTVSFSNGGGSTTTTNGGFYSRQVPPGWSGTITPSSSSVGGFNPASRGFTNVTSDLTFINFTVWPKPIVSGRVTLAETGEGLDGIQVAIAPQGPYFVIVATTANGGYYSAEVPAGVNVVITPNYAYGTFNPINRNVNTPAGLNTGGLNFTMSLSSILTPPSMKLIPGGNYVMGANTNISWRDSNPDELPMHTVSVKSFFMDEREVTKGLFNWIRTNVTGYSIGVGAGKADSHPVGPVTWYAAVIWCNARSEAAGLTPVYYTDAGLTTVYKSGNVAPFVKWGANGYRLPTEAEWEKAARGGGIGAFNALFPWHDADWIEHARANYFSRTNEWYDISPTRGSHPTYAVQPNPFTSPAGSFAPNGYGLYDMAGNAWEWCWDYYDSNYYSISPSSNPSGPSFGSDRVLRGGHYGTNARGVRVVARHKAPANFGDFGFGFRCVRGY